MAQRSKEAHFLFLMIVGLLAWLVPGAGHLVLGKKRHAAVIFVTVVLTLCTGLYIGSVGVVNPVGAKPWYVAQVMNTPAVAALGQITRSGEYPVHGRPSEIGQIYTSIAGLLNLLCIVNAVYLAHLRRIESVGD
ncbi:MAG: hypothetical protein CEE38_02480 [Planctomycetes bacterium B3_Pla]|nr:MAG: hypothetical protein CEE38_02480 [Planctomycetes bacterium B3_Pla]